MPRKTQQGTMLQVNLGSFVAFVAALFLLIGLYASVRIGINLNMYKNKYPTTGVLNLSLTGQPPFIQREEDCSNPMTYYTSDGKPRPATKEDKDSEKVQQQVCINSVKATRDATKINDINTALFFLFLGAGLLIVKKFFFTAK